MLIRVRQLPATPEAVDVEGAHGSGAFGRSWRRLQLTFFASHQPPEWQTVGLMQLL